MIGAIVLIHIGRLPLGHTIKTNFIEITLEITYNFIDISDC